MLAAMRAGWDQGYRAFKIRMDWGPLRIDADPAKDRAMVRLCRESLPDGTWLGFDANRGYSVSTAIRQGRVLEELGVAHFEEPLPSHDRPGVRAVAAALDIPVSTGENEHDRWALPRPARAGRPGHPPARHPRRGWHHRGPTHLRRWRRSMASRVMPHSPATGILLAASTQLYATVADGRPAPRAVHRVRPHARAAGRAAGPERIPRPGRSRSPTDPASASTWMSGSWSG